MTTDRRPGDNAAFEIAVHRGIGALPASWPAATAPGPARFHVFQSREFLCNWAETIGTANDAGELLLVEVFRDGAPVAMLPLRLARRGFARVLGFADGGVADYNAPVLFPVGFSWTPELARALWRDLAGALPRFDVVGFTKMPAEIGGLVNPLALITEVANAESCHGNDLTRSWEDILATQNQLRTTRRNIRKLEAMGELRFEIADTPEKRDRFIAAAIAQKQYRFEETHVQTFNEKPELRRYFERGTEAFAEAGMLLLAALTLDGKPLATTWNLIQGRHLYGIMVAFEPGETARLGTGRILNLKLLEHLVAEGFEYYDQGIGDEQYKVDHCDTTVPLVSHLEPVTARGRAWLALRDGREALRGTALWQKARHLKWEAKRSLRHRRDGAAGASPADALDRVR